MVVMKGLATTAGSSFMLFASIGSIQPTIFAIITVKVSAIDTISALTTV